eukprot:scaffold90639_cov66-Phaeocystis_antarctica.AAC.1
MASTSRPTTSTVPCCALLTRRRPLPASMAAVGVRVWSQAHTLPDDGASSSAKAAGGTAADGLPCYGPTALPMLWIGSVGMS